jgi:hypothetical protein
MASLEETSKAFRQGEINYPQWLGRSLWGGVVEPTFGFIEEYTPDYVKDELAAVGKAYDSLGLPKLTWGGDPKYQEDFDAILGLLGLSVGGRTLFNTKPIVHPKILADNNIDPVSYYKSLARKQQWNIDDPQYHWTTADVDKFRIPENRFGKVGNAIYMSTDKQRGKRHLHSNKNEDTRDVYLENSNGTEYYPEGSNVMPLVYRGDLAPYDLAFKFAQELTKKKGKFVGHKPSWEYAQEKLKKLGYKGIKVSDNEVAIFSPSDLKSIFSKFDPRYIDTGELSK